MKKLMKNILTLVMIMWAIGSWMFIAGEPINGSQIESILGGLISFGLCIILWRELERRDLIINSKK